MKAILMRLAGEEAGVDFEEDGNLLEECLRASQECLQDCWGAAEEQAAILLETATITAAKMPATPRTSTEMFTNQRNALIEFRNSTGHSTDWTNHKQGWGNLEHFSSPMEFNMLDGVEFGTFGMSINLSGCGLNGQIPDSIGIISNLIKLDLSWNNLHGAIPACLSEMPSLKELSLFRNCFEGQVPKRFRPTRDIEQLHAGLNKSVNLHGNQLSRRQSVGFDPRRPGRQAG